MRNQSAHDAALDAFPLGWTNVLCRKLTVLTKVIIIGFMIAILYSLGSSFYFLVHDKGEGDRTVRRLSWRVGLSLLLVLLLFAGFKLGIIEPRGANPVQYPAAGSPGP
jgi:succinate dehydrogenase/fumarate reductase cytochrome b subunit